MLKKLVTVLIISAFFMVPGAVKAEDQVVICPQAYGAGVVCGVHTTVNTGFADNIPMIATGLFGASGVFAYFSNKLKKTN